MELDDLVKNLRDYFLLQYKGSSPTPSKTFIAFEPLGHMLSPDDFKLNGEFDATVADEELSRMCDKVPAIDDVFMADGTRTLSGTYQELLDSMEFDGRNVTAVDKTPYLAKFAKIKNRAQQLCRSVSSVENPMDSIYLTRGTPTGWYDTNSSIWTRSSINQISVSRTDTAPVHTNRMLWKIQTKNVPDEKSQITKIVRDHRLTDKINAASLQQSVKAQANTNIAVLKNRLQPVSIARSTEMPRGAAKITVGEVQASPIEATRSALPATTPSSSMLVPPPVVTNTVLVINRQNYMAINVAVPFAQKVALNRELGVTDNIQTQEVKSAHFQMDFSFAVVTLERSWVLSDVFDNAGLWYAIMHKADHYSNGNNANDNTGTLRAIPKAMIVVKDLSITAEWSEEDRKAAVTSLGIGCFNTSNSFFNSANKNQFVAPGAQVVGWVCETLPQMPVGGDANLR